MPYVNRELLRISLEALDQSYSGLVMVSIPCMIKRGVPTCISASQAQEKGIAFGAADERQWLNDYFAVPGGPPDKPYFMPGTSEWVQQRYADRALQRRRKDFEDSVFFHPDRNTWAFREDAAEILAKRVIPEKPPISLVALMAWMWRDRDIKDLESAVDQFVDDIGLDRNNFVGSVFSKDIPKEFRDAGLSENPLDATEIADLTGAQRPPPTAPALADLATQIHDQLKKNHFHVESDLIHRVIGGWLTQDIVVLVGPTGSGKTKLSILIGRALEKILGEDRFFSSFLEITPDSDLSQFIGYENLAGDYTPGTFAREVLFQGSVSDPRLVILDEWNLAQIDTYFAPLLSAVETRAPLRLPGQVRVDSNMQEDMLRAQPDLADGRWRLPEDTFFVATCNSWAEEPDTRLPISGPVKRRCRIIPMPNILVDVLAEKGRDGVADFCTTLLAQERRTIVDRIATGRNSILDAHRAKRLEDVSTFDQLDENTRNQLLTLSRILLENTETSNVITPGILKDLLLACVYAESGSEYSALGQQVADKLLPQLQGDPQILGVIHDNTRDFPNAAEIASLIKQMGGLGSQRRIQPLI